MWDDMFTLGLPALEKILRPVVVYLFLLVGLRLAGKRELAQLTTMDLIVLLTISNTVQNAIIGNDNSVTGGLIGATALLLLNYAIVRFLFAHPRFDRIVEGEPVTLIQDGHIRADRMQQELITRSELRIAAHRQGFSSLSEVNECVLEASGVISFVGKEPSPEESHRREMTSRLDALAKQLDELKALVAGK